MLSAVSGISYRGSRRGWGGTASRFVPNSPMLSLHFLPVLWHNSHTVPFPVIEYPIDRKISVYPHPLAAYCEIFVIFIIFEHFLRICFSFTREFFPIFIDFSAVFRYNAFVGILTISSFP
jgi:hypothetical protein